MSKIDVERFLFLTRTDEIIKQKFFNIVYKHNKDKSVDWCKVIQDEIVPLAAQSQLYFSTKDFEDVVAERQSELNEEQLLQVVGGLSARNVAGSLLGIFLISSAAGSASSLAESNNSNGISSSWAPFAMSQSVEADKPAGGLSTLSQNAVFSRETRSNKNNGVGIFFDSLKQETTQSIAQGSIQETTETTQEQGQKVAKVDPIQQIEETVQRFANRGLAKLQDASSEKQNQQVITPKEVISESKENQTLVKTKSESSAKLRESFDGSKQHLADLLTKYLAGQKNDTIDEQFDQLANTVRDIQKEIDAGDISEAEAKTNSLKNEIENLRLEIDSYKSGTVIEEVKEIESAAEDILSEGPVAVETAFEGENVQKLAPTVKAQVLPTTPKIDNEKSTGGSSFLDQIKKGVTLKKVEPTVKKEKEVDDFTSQVTRHREVIEEEEEEEIYEKDEYDLAEEEEYGPTRVRTNPAALTQTTTTSSNIQAEQQESASIFDEINTLAEAVRDDDDEITTDKEDIDEDW